jgi:uncharacterized membrane protein
MIKKIAIVLTGCILFYSCYNRKEELLYGSIHCEEVSYANDVSNIIQTRCAGCHRAGSTIGPGPLTNYTQVKNAAAQIKQSVVSGSMPRGSTLTADQIQIISCWVNIGAPNN